MAVDTPARHVYTGNGNTRVFPIPTRIIGDDYVRIEIDGIHLTDRTQWDIVNNSVIFLTAPINGSEINIQVATSEEALSVLGSVTNVDIVAKNIEDVNNVVDNITGINIVASNKTNIDIAASNITEIQNASTNASVATTKALEASASAISAYNSSVSAGNSSTNASNSEIKANKWADNNYNVEVETGKYSAKHWATVSQNSIGVKVVENISSLKTFSINEANQIEVLGYYTKGDGGGGLFYWDSTSTETNNGGTIIQATGVATGRWKRVFSGAINVKWFGAKGDGITDDTASIQNALALKGVINGEGNYKTSETLVLDSDTILKNIKINSMATIVFMATGTENGYITLSVDAVNDAFSCTVSNASSFVIDGWAFIKSNEYWSISDNVKMGEYVKIKNIVGNVLYFYDSIVGTYLVSDSASISPIVHKENIQFNNVSINGDVLIDNQQALKFTLCRDVRINNLKSKDFDYSHINFDRCVNYIVDGGESSKTGVQEGLDYGVGHSRGCYNGKVINYTGNAMRHISTIGGSEGISRFITVDKCFGYNLTNAGIDAHSAVYEHSFTNNFLSFDYGLSTTIDGIISGGGNPTISNNTLVNCRRHGVFWQPLIKQTNAKITGIISNINAKGNKLGTTTYTVNVTGSATLGEAIIDGCSISTIRGSGFDVAIGVKTNISEINNVVINSVNISNNTMERGIFINAYSNNINKLVINGCNLENVSGINVHLFGSETYGVREVNISGNIIKGGTTGVVGNGVIGGKIANNLIKGYSASKFLFDSNSNIAIDKGITKIQTGSSTYTLLTHETDFIYNRASTLVLTLPDPTVNEDMEIRLKTIQAFAINSASANVVPINSVTAGTAILPATAGAWCTLKSNGSNWVTVQKG